MNESLIEIFKEQPGGIISGEYLSERLQISRTAVWKQIQKLKEEGYDFEAIPRSGYRLNASPEKLDLQKLLTGLNTKVLGKNIKLYDVVDSTQRLAHEAVTKGAREGTLIVAEQQTVGRGRMGRVWHSPRGKGVWMSLVLKPVIPLQFMPQLTLLTAVALCRAMKIIVPTVEVGIKWPNDLLIGGKKVAGILLESSAEDERLHYVIAGIGTSVNLGVEDFPSDLLPIATSLYIASGQKVDRVSFIQAFLEQLEFLYELYKEQGFAPIRTLWEVFSVTLGRTITIRTPAGTTQGTATAIDEMGALIVLTEGGEQFKAYSGDVEFTHK